MKQAALFPLILLAGCATTVDREPVIRTISVKIPVAAVCVPVALPATPDYPDSDEALLAAPDAAERYRLVAAGRLLRNQRLLELEPIIMTCREVSK